MGASEPEGNPDLSIVIITLNEEQRLQNCLDSLPSGVELIVLDSGSSDGTCAIAEAAGARVYHREFTGYASQKNAACAHARRGWIFTVDADEVLDEELRDALHRLCSGTLPDGTDQVAGYAIRRRLVFMNRVMRWGKTADRPVRLFRRARGRYEGEIHEVLHCDGPVARLKQGRLYHHSYHDLTDYFKRFNRYTSAVADKHRRQGHRPSLIRHILRPWSEFISRYFIRLGFLDGYPGYTWALVSSLYAYVKYAKLMEPDDGNGG